MKQATQPGFYTNDDGVDVFVPAGAVRPDNHPEVAKLTAEGHWKDIPVDEPAAPAPAPARAPKRGQQ